MSRLVVALALLASVNATVFFEDRFTNGMEKWKSSNWKPDEMGTWTHTSGEWFGDEEECKGMATTDDMKHHAISAQLDTPASTTGDKPLIVQFTVKHEKKDYSFCGGGYIKLLSKLNQDTFGGDDEYEIMFGPDLCGYDVSRIHLIFNHEKENLLKDEDIKLEYDEKNEYTHLYTLILENDGTYQVLFDEKEKAKGKLSEEWGFPSEFIKDPEQSKPKDWVDVKKIEDPEEVKPEGYDDIKAEIPDPDAEKPDDWDDEDDGEWEAPLIDNPEYKGPWKPTMIDNPEYKGPWEHPMIPNPDYKEDPTLATRCNKCGMIGFELWQVKSGTIFDDIIVTDSLDEAKAFAQETFFAKKDAEAAMFDKIEEEHKAQEKAERDAKKAAEEDEEEEEDDEDYEEPHDEL